MLIFYYCCFHVFVIKVLKDLLGFCIKSLYADSSDSLISTVL